MDDGHHFGNTHTGASVAQVTQHGQALGLGFKSEVKSLIRHHPGEHVYCRAALHGPLKKALPVVVVGGMETGRILRHACMPLGSLLTRPWQHSSPHHPCRQHEPSMRVRELHSRAQEGHQEKPSPSDGQAGSRQKSWARGRHAAQGRPPQGPPSQTAPAGRLCSRG